MHDGGPAFPSMIDKGMTLLDYLAGQALAGYYANVDLDNTVKFQTIAEDCYGVAAEMLVERRRLDQEEQKKGVPYG